MHRNRQPLLRRNGILLASSGLQQAKRLTPEAQWALWALLAGIVTGLSLAKLLLR